MWPNNTDSSLTKSTSDTKSLFSNGLECGYNKQLVPYGPRHFAISASVIRNALPVILLDMSHSFTMFCSRNRVNSHYHPWKTRHISLCIVLSQHWHVLVVAAWLGAESSDVSDVTVSVRRLSSCSCSAAARWRRWASKYDWNWVKSNPLCEPDDSLLLHTHNEAPLAVIINRQFLTRCNMETITRAWMIMQMRHHSSHDEFKPTFADLELENQSHICLHVCCKFSETKR